MREPHVTGKAVAYKIQIGLRAAGLLCLVCSLLPSRSNATTYFVSTHGNDANPGTLDQPFRHLSKGASVAVAGDTVMVKDGRYGNESVVAPGYVVTLHNSGTPTHPIIFVAENRGGAVLDAMNTVKGATPCNGASAYIDLANASYIVIQGFAITRGCDEGIHNNSSAHHIVIRQNEIHHIANRFITDTYGRAATGCPATGHDITIDGNVIHDIGRTNTSFTASLDHGLYTSCKKETIINNVFYNQVTGWDIQLASGADHVLIANNTFASRNPRQPGQVMVWNAHTDLIIENNIFFNAPQYAVTTYTASVNQCEINHNLISGSAAVYGGSGCRIRLNQMNRDPMFVDPSAHDYQLLPGSPALASGVNVPAITADASGKSRPVRSPFDVGAFQLNRPPAASRLKLVSPASPVLFASPAAGKSKEVPSAVSGSFTAVLRSEDLSSPALRGVRRE